MFVDELTRIEIDNITPKPNNFCVRACYSILKLYKAVERKNVDSRNGLIYKKRN